MTDNPAPELLAEISRLLYGPNWRDYLPEALGINKSSVRDWANGRNRTFTMQHGVWIRIRELIEERREVLARLSAQCAPF